MEDLKGRTVRGGLAKLCGQVATLLVRVVAMVVLARLLEPQDFGLVAMVTAVTGVYSLFTSAGLSSATIQKLEITNEQISTLFWINTSIGALFGFVCVATAPILVQLYHEPRIFWVCVAMGAGFLFSAAGVQHTALLQRHLRYVALSVVETVSQLVSAMTGIGMAIAGFGYWSLVAAAIVLPAVNTFSVYMATSWIPGMPRRGIGIRPMLRFGGTITVNTFIVYIAYNFDKVLIGRFWGADALGIYGRAYQLVNIPTDNLNTAIGGVAFSALSRLQHDPIRLRNYFLKGYALLMSMTFPITLFSACFADDIVLVVFGPKWSEAAVIFRLLTPTILIFGMINPLAWLMYAVGLQVRSLKVALVIAPLVMIAYIVGLPYGPSGVALAFSAAMMLWLVPHLMWCLHGSMISPWDLLPAVSRPFFAGLAATGLAFVVQYYCGQFQSPILRLFLAGNVMLASYFAILVFVMGQRPFYADLLKELKKPPQLT
jgi:PST family polysaccharide transporter